jgi:hypothetical protein
MGVIIISQNFRFCTGRILSSILVKSFLPGTKSKILAAEGFRSAAVERKSKASLQLVFAGQARKHKLRSVNTELSKMFKILPKLSTGSE